MRERERGRVFAFEATTANTTDVKRSATLQQERAEGKNGTAVLSAKVESIVLFASGNNSRQSTEDEEESVKRVQVKFNQCVQLCGHLAMLFVAATAAVAAH